MLRRFLSLVAALMAAVLFYYYSESVETKRELNDYIEDSNTYRSSMEITDNNIAVAWCKALIKKDYKACDSLSSSGDKKLYGYTGTEYSYKSNVSGDIYFKMLDKLSANIQSVSIKSVTQYDGYSEYYLEIEYYKYSEKANVSIDTDAYKSLCESYIANEISDVDYEKGLSALYISSFDSMFTVSDKTLYKEVIPLSVKTVDNLEYVYGTGDFVLKMYRAENIETLLTLYETNISKEINKYMITY